MRLAMLSLAVAPLLFAALPAAAGDRTIPAAIAAGNYAQAQKAIQAELRIYPGRPELLLNLAAVYAKTGREAEAKALYAKVLDQRPVLMDLSAEKVASSHAVASTGLRQVQAIQLSSR